VPLNETGMQNNDYLAIWHNLLLPIAYEYNPELVLISAGYDAGMSFVNLFIKSIKFVEKILGLSFLRIKPNFKN
jgi:hypothetical protein